MTKDNVISLDDIDFLGFSCSKNWAGYFEAKDISDINLVRQSTKIVYEYFKDRWDEFFLLGALSYTDESDDSIRQRFGDLLSDALTHYLNIYHHAINSGFLMPWNDTFEEFYDNELNSPKLPANMITLNFNHQTLLDYCELLMVFCFSPVIGQACFLINPALKIALYPHDDTGFGVISLSEDRAVADNFLKFCGKFDDFKVHNND